jgi:hypothetical protein
MQTEILDADTEVARIVSTQPESPEQTRQAHNEHVLAQIESGLFELETAIAKLDSLAPRQPVLPAKSRKSQVLKLNSGETNP